MKNLNGDELLRHSLYLVYRPFLKCKNFQKSRNHPKIPGTGLVIKSIFDTKDSQQLGANIQNFLFRANWHPEFEQHTWPPGINLNEMRLYIACLLLKSGPFKGCKTESCVKMKVHTFSADNKRALRWIFGIRHQREKYNGSENIIVSFIICTAHWLLLGFYN